MAEPVEPHWVLREQGASEGCDGSGRKGEVMAEERMAGQNFCEVAAACKLGLIDWENCSHEGRAIFAQAEAMLVERLKPSCGTSVTVGG
jgi:hypothetical protein